MNSCSVLTHLRSIGCQVLHKAAKRRRDDDGKTEENEEEAPDNGGWSIKLVAPLQFPEVRKKRLAKKR